MEAPVAGYAPSYYQIKQWPFEAQIEGWLSFLYNIQCFVIVTVGLHLLFWLDIVILAHHVFSCPPEASMSGLRQFGVGTPDAKFSGLQDKFVLTSPSIEGMTEGRYFAASSFAGMTGDIELMRMTGKIEPMLSGTTD